MALARMKYQPLEEYLRGQSTTTCTLTFAQIERVMGDALPPSARDAALPWWANGGGHVQTRAWENAGWVAAVDHRQQSVTFTRRQA